MQNTVISVQTPKMTSKINTNFSTMNSVFTLCKKNNFPAFWPQIPHPWALIFTLHTLKITREVTLIENTCAKLLEKWNNWEKVCSKYSVWHNCWTPSWKLSKKKILTFAALSLTLSPTSCCALSAKNRWDASLKLARKFIFQRFFFLRIRGNRETLLTYWAFDPLWGFTSFSKCKPQFSYIPRK